MQDLLEVIERESVVDDELHKLLDKIKLNDSKSEDREEMRVHYKQSDGSTTAGNWAATNPANATLLAYAGERLLTEHDAFTIQIDNIIVTLNTEHLASIAIEVGKTEEPELDFSLFAR